MIPVDLEGAIRRGLEKDRRPPDGLLHCSSDILGSLRHAQLRLAGAPTIESELVSDVRLRTGTMWHDLIREFFVNEGLAVMGEVRLGEYLPEGWQGTADWLFWDFQKRCFVLGDLKTIKGEGMRWIEKDGAKPEHIAQLSAYYWALVDAGMPIRKGFWICYLPMNDVGKIGPYVVGPPELSLIEVMPLDRDYLHGLMAEKWIKTVDYLRVIEATDQGLVNDALEPPTPREQQLVWDKSKGHYDLKLVPSWKTRYCPYPNELCDCSEQGTTKIGHFEWSNETVRYTPRKGFENVVPMFSPTVKDFEKRAA